jgi:hypothetical protein
VLFGIALLSCKMSLDSTLQPESLSPATVRLPKLVAVVDIGASAIRMAIAEITDDGPVRTLENLTQAVSLGRDTFSRKARSIPRRPMTACGYCGLTARN